MRYQVLALLVVTACKGDSNEIQVKEPGGCVRDSRAPQEPMSCLRSMRQCEERLRRYEEMLRQDQETLRKAGRTVREEESTESCTPTNKYVCVGDGVLAICRDGTDPRDCADLQSVYAKLENGKPNEPCKTYIYKP